MRRIKVQNVMPRNGETHGLFGVRYLKHHMMRAKDWTADDMVEQYERLANIYERANEAKKLQKERIELKSEGKLKKLKKQYKDKVEELNTLINGDEQRTKNVLLNFPNYMQMYHSKRSEEVLEEMDNKTFMMRKALDRYVGERERLIKEYERKLLDVANFQEMICYYDVKEFRQERDTKRLYIELKNSETRNRAIEKINLTYKMIIDQMLHDSLYYLPVLEALNEDWKEQTTLVQQTFNIGYPAIKQAKKVAKEVQQLSALSKKEEAERFKDLNDHRQILKEHPQKVKKLVRRDSDFMPLKDRYCRDTKSMTNLRRDVEDLEQSIERLKHATLCNSSFQIIPRANFLMTKANNWSDEVIKFKKQQKDLIDRKIIVNFVHDMLLDDDVNLYDEVFIKENSKLQNAINVEQEKQRELNEVINDRREVLGMLTFSLHHIMSVLRHVGEEEIYKKFEYPSGVLRVNLLKFFKSRPKQPDELENKCAKLLSVTKSKVEVLLDAYKMRNPSKDEENAAVKKFQHAVIEDSFNTFRPKVEDDHDE